MNKQTRRTIILTATILGAALLGLYATGSLENRHDPTAAEALGQVLQEATPGQVNANTVGSPFWAIIKLVSALAVVIVALYGGLFLLKRMMTTRRSASAGQSALEVIESAYVGPKKTVSLVRVGNRAVLVGVTDQQISKLIELDKLEIAELLARTPQQKSVDTFARMFKRTTDKFREMQTSKEHPVVGA